MFDVCTHVCIYVCMYIHMYVCMYVHTYVCMYVCMYVCICVHMYVRMYVCNYQLFNFHQAEEMYIYLMTEVMITLIYSIAGNLLHPFCLMIVMTKHHKFINLSLERTWIILVCMHASTQTQESMKHLLHTDQNQTKKIWNQSMRIWNRAYWFLNQTK